jgi:Protein of unknown function (DUF3006).
MKHLTIDRMDGIYAICEDKDRKMFAIPKSDLPAAVREGDKLDIDDEGNVSVNGKATSAARAETRRKEDSLFEN